MATKYCGCANIGQDKIHGKGMRVMNATANGGLRCTVCLKIHDGGGRR